MSMSTAEADIPLRQLAVLAANANIKGSSLKRNALLKPLDLILEALAASLHPESTSELLLLRAAAKTEIFNFLERIASGEYKPGKNKASQVNAYVDLFFDGVLGTMHHGQVSAILGRERTLRAAYLFWVRQRYAEIFAAKARARGEVISPDEAVNQLELTADDTFATEDVEGVQA